MLIGSFLFLLFAYCSTAATILNRGPAAGIDSLSDSSLSSPLSPRDGNDPGLSERTAPCSGNSPDDRSTWCDYDIDTDYATIVPETNVVREYWFEVDEITASPDGYPRPAMAVNGSIPGPTIYADWGDTVVVHVTNRLHESRNGSSIHWHGIRQLNAIQQDGVVSITQCPIAPDTSLTYRWRAMQYGSTWYHSHIGLQAWEGVFGGIIINGPATANYDVDKGVVFLNDWSHRTADELWYEAQRTGPPPMQNGLINGTNEFGTGENATGSRFTTKVDEGSSYRLRLVNAALDTHYRFSIDNHTLTVIAMDLVPIEPYTADSITIGMGQRYDVIITANQSSIADSFWIRATPQCVTTNEMYGNIRGILHYTPTPSTPTTDPFAWTDSCLDEPYPSLVPHLPKTVSPPDWDSTVDVTAGLNPANLIRWYLNSTAMEVHWENPTLLRLANNDTSFEQSSAVIPLPEANKWAYLVINTTIPAPHPIHLHGHDFFVLAQGSNPWDGTVQMDNPPRRDTAVLPGEGYLVLAFETDNPGAWLMHCHLGWHTSQGFALQFVERESEILGLVDEGRLRETCEAWVAYDEENDVEQDDSGV